MVKIICVGKIKEKFFTEAIAEYTKRLSRYTKLQIIEIPESRFISDSDAHITAALEQEAKLILSKVSGCLVVLDIDGMAMTSPKISQIITTQQNNGKDISFVIGSSHGLDLSVKSAADYRVSFGAVTYPHQLMRVILTEQIYRAFTIINNTPYHK